MVCKSCLILFACASVFISTVVLAETPQKITAETAKLTFTKDDEIPFAFVEASSNVASTEGSTDHEPRRISYSTCQDGSGGLCVSSGQCPTDLKPSKVDKTACAEDQECCFGVPTTDKSCRNRGGECVKASECGRAHKLQGTSCSDVDGKVCCVYT